MTQKLKNITFIAKSLGLRENEIELSGSYKAKIKLSVLERLTRKKNSKYILVSAITPTPFGEGKTVTTIGLSMALNRLKFKSACALRQSSIGPLFGTKGMATGGGVSQVLPACDINLHLTGDSHAVSVANNLLVSFLENSIFHGNPLNINPESIVIKRCLDINDRSLRHIKYSLKSNGSKFEISTGFEITAASEVMSILTLSRNLEDMCERLGDITVARNYDGLRVTARDLKADGMMAVVLKDAIKPNLVQTAENTPCFIHTGPFANISIGSSSVIADRIALGLCDYVVTESGFGVDCGGEKFFDIKCRVSGFKPDACVLVCSVRGIKAQSKKFNIVPGEKPGFDLFKEDIEALEEGIVNLKKHIENVKHFGVTVIVCVNIFPADSKNEVEFVKKEALKFGAHDCVESYAWAQGSKGALGLAESVVRHTRNKESDFESLYSDEFSIKEKIELIAKKIYGAGSVDYAKGVLEALDIYAREGFGNLPVCIAKTQFSLSADEALKGAPEGFVFPIKEVKLSSGAGFILAQSSLMQTMPGLPRSPRGEQVDIDDEGNVIGLS